MQWSIAIAVKDLYGIDQLSHSTIEELNSRFQEAIKPGISSLFERQVQNIHRRADSALIAVIGNCSGVSIVRQICSTAKSTRYRQY